MKKFMERFSLPRSKPGAALPATLCALAAVAAVAMRPRISRVQTGQVAVITGGSRGFGLALARQFGRAGLKLVLAARHADELAQARRSLLHDGDVQHQDDILLVDCDLTDREQCARLIDAALRTFGKIDVLVNNAGIIEVGAFEDQPLEAYDRAMATNFFAALHTTYAALPSMLERRSGAIVNIASIGGKVAVPHMLPYSAAKFALVGFSEGLHAETRSKGVRVTTVCPGLMRTGGEVHAQFVGDVEKEKRWFGISAKTPGIAVAADDAAHAVFRAVNAGRAEITISPQAWLAARVHGLAPETTQFAASLANRFLLPESLAQAPASAPLPASHADEPFVDPSPS